LFDVFTEQINGDGELANITQADNVINNIFNSFYYLYYDNYY